jgi:hypothetical protein
MLAGRALAEDQLLQVSDDPTREFSIDLNDLVVAHWLERPRRRALEGGGRQGRRAAPAAWWAEAAFASPGTRAAALAGVALCCIWAVSRYAEG